MSELTPAEMRGRAHSLLIAINSAPDIDEPELAAFRANALATIHATRRLADVIEYVDMFVSGDPDNTTPGGSIARVVKRIARGEVPGD